MFEDHALRPEERAPPADAGLLPEDVRRCVEVLQALVTDRGLLAGIPADVREALLVAAGRVSHPNKAELRRLARAHRRNDREKVRDHDRQAVAAAEIRVAREAPVFVPPPKALGSSPSAQAKELRTPRDCYVCKAPYRTVHSFYDSMCPACAELNYAKRFASAPMDGRVALVTGARVKIGFQIALKLLRAGARVVATTRFPHDAAGRYAQEPDFAEWKDRLQVHGLDLRHSPSVELFARYLCGELPRLDVLVNNACQTVRRPPGFYKHLIESESRALPQLPEAHRPLLRAQHELKAALAQPALPHAAEPAELAAWRDAGELGAAAGLRESARLSLVPYAFEDDAHRADLFPEGQTDADRQQIDLRAHNSWRLMLGEVPTPELLEVHLVNAVAPFILCSRLKPLLMKGPSRARYIVNVSAMEGIFSRGTKTARHPHTNMAKAALNMLTCTSAREYVQDGIYMTAVDTGWVTDEDPAAIAERKRKELGFQPPLDIVDGAARVLDPVFSGEATGEPPWGVFLKDYRVSPW
ncbi:MAG: SDR family NAD(P)-dependent oxidoreductase [Planctomycetes bacterium]|nr:SDR family NAD(P)-dependent oxidoreductase [Planctomycetota bacterium]